MNRENEVAKKANILIVDDDAGMRTTLSDILEFKGYSTRAAATGQEALDQLGMIDFASLLLDLHLPDMHGTKLLEQFNSMSPDTEVIIITGHATLDSAMDAVQHNVFAYMEKPIDPQRLLVTIRNSEEKRRLLIENKRLLEELKAANDRLEAKVAERTRELARANEDLRELDRMKAAFIDITSHELRTPLTVIETMVAISESVSSGKNRDFSRMMKVTGRASKRLKKLATRISGFAKMGEFEGHLELTPARPGDLLEKVIMDVSPFIEMREQNLQVDAPENLPDVPMDSGKIRDVLLNLLMNAIKFTPDNGEIRLSVKDTRAGMVEFRVSDTGIGIRDEDKSHIFDEFFTSFETLHHSSGDYQFDTRGIGLGLAIVKKFVVMHGGDIGLETSPGEGSSFWFHLPV